MKKMEKKRFSVTVCLLLLAITLAVSVPLAYAGTTSTGSIVVNTQAPTVAAGGVYNSGDTVNDNNTVLSVWTEYHVNWTTTDPNSLLQISNAYVTIWDSGGVTQSAADVNASHYTFLYTNSTNVWSEVGPGPSGAHIITGNCAQPSDKTQTSGQYKLAFKLDYVANYTYAAGNKSWKVSINTTDTGSNTAINTTLIFGVAFYNSISVTDTTHSWTVSSLPATNQTLTAPGDGAIDMTVTANGVWNLQAEGSADPSDGAGHSITIGHILMHLGTLASATNMTTGFANVGGETSQSAGSNLVADITLWLNVPAGQYAATYTYTLTVQVTAVS
jgi:hypothetical protein